MKTFFLTRPIKILSALGLVLITGCSTTPPKSMMNIQTGEFFTLNQPITIAADAATQFIQFGQLSSRNGFSRFDPHCRIEIKQLSEQPQTLLPETFTISKVQIGEEQVASNALPLLAMAQQQTLTDLPSLEQRLLANNDSDSQRPETMDTVMLYLEPTAKNPNIFRLVCAGSLSDGSLKDAPRSYRPQRTQINDILGSLGKVSTP
ncbi:hypothetical protein [Thiosulfativibrio zosterae]|uniref:Lipoprotein n=1 Tax=Thiosulfativibrio zosterae TaxID=2675053 RepID=A0A6F8PJY9_9GAMM|nr:hypothetical protein [Thiosulfativibrio zosterae]BBP42388.1 hypothetical protein THMIRHAT_01340 [Thiosulfativibrio zosterae]